MKRIQILAALACVPLSTSIATAQAPTGPSITKNADTLSDTELDRRIEWLEQTLDDGAGNAKLYERSWTTIYIGGLGFAALMTGVENKHDDTINYAVLGGKSVIGLTRQMLALHPGRLGGEPIREIPGDDRAANLQRLAVGEDQLLKIAKRTEQRTDWRAHLANVVLNLAGGGIILGLGNPSDAAQSIGIGIPMGIVRIMWQPTRGEQDLADYKQRFSSSPQSWSFQKNFALIPMTNGAGIRVTF